MKWIKKIQIAFFGTVSLQFLEGLKYSVEEKRTCYTLCVDIHFMWPRAGISCLIRNFCHITNTKMTWSTDNVRFREFAPLSQLHVEIPQNLYDRKAYCGANSSAINYLLILLIHTTAHAFFLVTKCQVDLNNLWHRRGNGQAVSTDPETKYYVL